MKKFIGMLVLLFTLNMVDIFSTIYLLAVSDAIEINPLMNFILTNYGNNYAIIFKLFIGLVGCMLLYICRYEKNVKFYLNISVWLYSILIMWHACIYLIK